MVSIKNKAYSLQASNLISLNYMLKKGLCYANLIDESAEIKLKYKKKINIINKKGAGCSHYIGFFAHNGGNLF